MSVPPCANKKQNAAFRSAYMYKRVITVKLRNCEYLENSRNVDCVLANHNKVQDTQANLKTTN